MRLHIAAVLFYAALSYSAWPQEFKFSIAEYCEVTLKSSQLAELEWKDRIALVRSHQGNAKSLDIKLKTMESEYGRFRNQIYAQYGSTLHHYLRFGASHQAAISLYLDQNANTKAALEDASSRIQDLRREAESLMAARLGKESRK